MNLTVMIAINLIGTILMALFHGYFIVSLVQWGTKHVISMNSPCLIFPLPVYAPLLHIFNFIVPMYSIFWKDPNVTVHLPGILECFELFEEECLLNEPVHEISKNVAF